MVLHKGAPSPTRQFYGRRHGKALRPGRRQRLQTMLPQLAIDLNGVDEKRLDPKALFPRPVKDIWLEVGFGAGEHLAAQARRHTDIGFIGCEPFINGVARLVDDIVRERLDNIRLFTDDAMGLLPRLPDGILGRVYSLFSDPWPKKRHHKRRFVQDTVVTEMARLLRPGGQWYLATDDRSYAEWLLQRFFGRPEFDWQAARAQDWQQMPADGVPTRYQQKAASAGRNAIFLNYQRSAWDGAPSRGQ